MESPATKSDRNSLFKHVSNFHKQRSVDNYELSFENTFHPKLRKYQERAVKWMLKREKEEEIVEANGHRVSLPHGGILADEMGLGKTVEMLACILSNPCVIDKEPELRKVSCKRKHDLISDDDNSDDFEYQPKRKRAKSAKDSKGKNEKSHGIYSSKYTALRRHYESSLSEMSCITIRSSNSNDSFAKNSNKIQCFCDKNDSDCIEIVQCEVCNIWQHAVCLGIENGYSFGEVKCPQCWSKSDILPARATLIITPSSILDQWLQEIKKHVSSPDFKFLVYKGVSSHSYIQPPTLAGYDVVLTTYNVLCSELKYLQSDAPRSLRHAKKYYSPTSPLTCLNWWRICLDEAQMVEGYTSKTAIMAAQLNASCRWAVTGTPIQKSIQDLYGLIVFLHVKPFDNLSDWNQLRASNAELYNFLQYILWRSSKEEVNEELGIPPQTVYTHWLHFSPVEAYFYRVIHSECAACFRHKLHRYPNLDVKLSEIDRKDLRSFIYPLLGIRKACTHPQVVRGKFVKYKHTMTMEELMTQMVAKARIDAEGALRQVVASLHGIAGINIIECAWQDAAENYRKVLQLSKQHENVVKVDQLQMIHCLHNLSEVLEEHGAGIPPTLRDSELKSTAKSLEVSYLQKYSSKLQTAKEALSKITALIAHQCKGHPLSFTGWWEILINSDIDEEDLLNKVKTFLDDNVVPGQQNLSEKLTGLHAVHREIAVWLGNADNLREEIMAAMRYLELLPSSDFIEAALVCHVNNERKRKKGVMKCHICATESLLKKYEAHIFSVNKWNLNETLNDDGEDDEEDDEDEEKLKGEGKDLKDVVLFRTNKESSWKPTSQERMLNVLANYAKRVSAKLAEEGSQHLALLENVRKEFKLIRAVWRCMSDQVYATDELYMAKLRMRLPVCEGDLAGINKKKANSLILRPEEVPLQLLRFQEEYNQAEAALKRTTGTLFYLKNLQKSGSTEQECPVCKEALTDKWSVLNCGHCCCFECIPALFRMCGHEIDCPLCRVRTPKDSVSYVVSRATSSSDSELNVKGSHSTKVTAVIAKLLSLLKEEPSVKVIIFSTWEKVLDIIKDGLIQNNISYRRLESGGRFKTNLSQFKSGAVTVLLLHVKHGAKGLNLTEATHLFFVEPLISPTEEQQAISRIHRIGQTKETFVHRFVIRNTIEERMFSSLLTKEEQWSQHNLTLRKLNSLFVLKEEPDAPIMVDD